MTNLKDISAILGLSVSTVCKAINGYPDVSEETRNKVLRVIEEIDDRGDEKVPDGRGERSENGGNREESGKP